MSVVLPNKYEHRGKLEQRGVLCITEEEARRADIRPLRVGILNIMPKGETYEPYVLFKIFKTGIHLAINAVLGVLVLIIANSILGLQIKITLICSTIILRKPLLTLHWMDFY